jgi:flagellar basal-body rod protein FlgC
MSLFASLRTSATGLTSQRLRMDLISNNVANAETTRTAEGGAYRRQQVLFMPKVIGRGSFFEQLRGTSPLRGQGLGPELQGVQALAIVEDQSPTRLAYDPTHPDANPDGFVEFPNVNVVTEMADMLSATRSYEANVTVFNAAKQMAQRAIDLAR